MSFVSLILHVKLFSKFVLGDEKAAENVKVDEDLFGDDDLDDIDAELGDMALEEAGMAS